MEIKKDQITTINVDSTTNVILIEILKELKELNKLFTSHDYKLIEHEKRITKLEREM